MIMDMKDRCLNIWPIRPWYETVFIIEASRETDFGWLGEKGYHMIKSKEYKTNKHVFAGRGE